MAIRLKHSSVYSTYFCTFTNFNWIDLCLAGKLFNTKICSVKTPARH